MRGITIFNYGGSGTIGLMNAGFEVPLVLEIDKPMIEEGAAMHFINNYPDIKVLPPEDWNNEEYLELMKNENWDTIIGWPPCSGLSMINRNASADNAINHYMYDWANAIKEIRPKTFIMENAPTLVTKGKPILNDIIAKLNQYYRFTIIRDYAGNHNCCMRRLRTMLVGWRRDIFKTIPVIQQNAVKTNVSEVLNKIDKNSPNMTLVPERTCQDLDWVIPDIKEPISIVTHICRNYKQYEDKLSDKRKKAIANTLQKIREDKGYFDKSPNKLKEGGLSPSLASVTELIHPTENRPLYIREYAAIMGYPDNFEFVDNCKAPYIQSIAQGVPANFIEWIAREVKSKLEAEFLVSNIQPHYDICYEHLTSGKTEMECYTLESFIDTPDITAKGE